MMEKIVYGIFYVIGMGLKLLTFGLIRLVGYGIRKHRENAPPVTITLNDNLRFEHTLITCGSGWGKTQLLQKQILEELPAVLAGERSVVVIDSQGDMIQKILHLAALTPSKLQEAKQQEPLQSATAEPQQKDPEKLPKERTGESSDSRIIRIVLVNLLVLAAIFIIVVFAQAFYWASQEENVTLRSILFAFGLISVPWLLLSSLIFSSGGDKRFPSQAISQVEEIIKRSTLADRLILIDPADIETPPALNLFDFGLDRIKDYSLTDQEKLVNGAIAMYEFMFGALLGAEMTNRQGVIFRYLARLMMVVPNATIYTLMDFLEDPEKAKPYVSKLDVATQRFLNTQFFAGGFDTTREQILSRLWGVLSNTTLARMFSHSKNKLNLFEAMNNGSLILINTNKELLKQEGCELFGRFMIALLSQATQERAAVPEYQRKPTFVYIDEAHDYFDDTLELLLNTARKYNVGLTLAHQNLAQFHKKLEQTVLASTSTKWAGGNSADDAYQLAKEMNCDKDLIRQLQKESHCAHFAFYARNVTQSAVEMLVPLGLMERQPRMKDEEYRELLAQNRKRIGEPHNKDILQQSTAASVSFDIEEQRAL